MLLRKKFYLQIEYHWYCRQRQNAPEGSWADRAYRRQYGC